MGDVDWVLTYLDGVRSVHSYCYAELAHSSPTVAYCPYCDCQHFFLHFLWHTRDETQILWD